MDNLKPCPFCGGLVRKRISFGGILLYECMNKKNCGAMVSFDSMHPEKSDESWNMRKQMDDLVEHLEEWRDLADFVIDREYADGAIEIVKGLGGRE